MRLNKITKILKTTCVTFIAMSVISFPSTSQADPLLRLAKNLCEAAKTDDRSLMRKKLKSAKIRLRNIYPGISCGSAGSLLRVATKSDAMQAATFIATKVGKKYLSEAEGDGKNIVQWTEDLVAAGDASKQVFLDLYNSKM